MTIAIDLAVLGPILQALVACVAVIAWARWVRSVDVTYRDWEERREQVAALEAENATLREQLADERAARGYRP